MFRWAYRLWLRNEWVSAYGLLLPTLLVMGSLLVFPIVLTLLQSFWTQTLQSLDKTPTLANYSLLISEEGAIYRTLLAKSLWMSLSATLAVVLLAYPMAYFMAFRVKRRKFAWLVLIIVPFWTSYLLRIFAWKIILGFNGVINSGLKSIGLIDQPLDFLLYNPTAVTIALAHAWAPYAILPIYVSLEKIDRTLLAAATDLGDGPLRRFLRVTFPLSLPGTLAALLLVFIPTVGDYVTPSLVGGTGGIMIGNSIAALFGKLDNAPLGAAVSIATMLVVTLVICAFLLMIGRGKMQKLEI